MSKVGRKKGGKNKVKNTSKIIQNHENNIKKQKLIINTGLYKESKSKRNPLYTTEVRSNSFGGRHWTLEDIVKEVLSGIPEIITYEGTNASDREAIAKKYKITIEEI